MKKIISLIISIIMLTGLCACTNTQTQTQTQKQTDNSSKPPLEAALDTFFDREADYDSTYFPAKFTQDDFDNCMNDEVGAENINRLLDGLAEFEAEYIQFPEVTPLYLVNSMLTLDYLLRPAFMENAVEFRQRILTMLNDDYLYNGRFMEFALKYYLLSSFHPTIDAEFAAFAVKIIDEYRPELPEARRENKEEFSRWFDYEYLAAGIEVIATGNEDRFIERDNANMEWMQGVIDNENK